MVVARVSHRAICTRIVERQDRPHRRGYHFGTIVSDSTLRNLLLSWPFALLLMNYATANFPTPITERLPAGNLHSSAVYPIP